MTAWSQFRADASHTATRRDDATPARPTEAWTVALDGATTAPVIAGETVFVGTDRGVLSAFDAETGRRRGAVEAGGALGGGPAVAGETVCYATADGTVAAFEPATGATRWDQSLSAVPAETVVTAAEDGDGDVAAETTSDDATAWPRAAEALSSGDAVDSPLAHSRGVVYVPHAAGVTAIDAEEGRPLWTHAFACGAVGAPAIAGRRVFVARGDETVCALDAGTGREVWRVPTDGTVVDCPVATDDRVYVADDRGTLLALAQETGQSWFTYQTDSPFTAAPTVVEDTVFVPAADGYLHVTDTTFGRRKLRGVLFAKKGVELDAAATANPAVVGDACCIGDRTGALYAISVTDPDFRWHRRVAEAGLGDVVADSGRLVFTTGDQTLSCWTVA